jgi:hypothetical protein
MMYVFLAGAVLLSHSVAATSVGPLYPSYVSLSIELASFPSFAGESNHPYQRVKELIGYLTSDVGLRNEEAAQCLLEKSSRIPCPGSG